MKPGGRDPRQAETNIQPAIEPSETQRLERHEERLVADVSTAEAGRVRVRRRVVEEQEEIDVTLRHDELDLERRKANRPLEAGEQPVQVRGETTVVLVIEERLEARRVPYVVEDPSPAAVGLRGTAGGGHHPQGTNRDYYRGGYRPGPALSRRPTERSSLVTTHRTDQEGHTNERHLRHPSSDRHGCVRQRR